MSPVIDCTSEDGMAEGIAAAAEAVRRGEVVVLPTDTVYGVGVDAFDSDAVAAVLTAKGRSRGMPLPVLIPNPETVDGLATNIPAYARGLIDAFWPGPLTLVLHSQGSLLWDLGETNGTVALRMPRNEVALSLLSEVGPMAVTSANISGHPPATTILDAATQLGSAVSVYLDAGPSADGSASAASTIVDCTRETPFILRAGAVSAEQVQQQLGDIELGS
jgi:L-threonylcarbamoyladenylate synthase